MPYTEAVIRESMRFETPLPNGIPHFTLQDTTLGGYNIPAFSVVLLNHHAMHHDKALWDDPENFRPERFISKENKIDLKKDITLPFGAGKRLCAGETFARNTTFLYVAAIFQHFKISLPHGQGIDAVRRNNILGLVTTPDEFWVKFTSY